MLNYLIRRLGYGVLILIGVNLFTFVLFFTVNTPDDMARLNIGGKRVTQEQIDKWKAERGYDKPLYWAAKEEGAAKLTRTIVWERSVSLFALPVVIALLAINLAFGVMSRAAPQLNIITIGFPVTILAGVMIVSLTLDDLRTTCLELFDSAFVITRSALEAR